MYNICKIFRVCFRCVAAIRAHFYDLNWPEDLSMSIMPRNECEAVVDVHSDATQIDSP